MLAYIVADVVSDAQLYHQNSTGLYKLDVILTEVRTQVTSPNGRRFKLTKIVQQDEDCLDPGHECRFDGKSECGGLVWSKDFAVLRNDKYFPQDLHSYSISRRRTGSRQVAFRGTLM